MFPASISGPWLTALILLFLSLASLGRADREGQLELRLARGGRDEIVSVAASFLGVSYRWSGDDSLKGFDSSGFVRGTLRANGYSFPRSIDLQLNSVDHISKDELEPADLVFFSNSLGQAMHVGLYMGDGQFIHASPQAGRVVLSQLKEGFFEERLLTAGRLQNLGVGNDREAIDTLNRHAPSDYITTYTTSVESVAFREDRPNGEPRVKSLFRRPRSYYYTDTSANKAVFEPTVEERSQEEESYQAWSLRWGEFVSMGRLSAAELLPF